MGSCGTTRVLPKRGGKQDAKPTFMELVELDFFDVSRQWLKPPPSTPASAAAAGEAAVAAAASAAVANAAAAAENDKSSAAAMARRPEAPARVVRLGVDSSGGAAQASHDPGPSSSSKAAVKIVYPDGWKEFSAPQGRKVSLIDPVAHASSQATTLLHSARSYSSTLSRAVSVMRICRRKSPAHT